jgi:hypothetical protein
VLPEPVVGQPRRSIDTVCLTRFDSRYELDIDVSGGFQMIFPIFCVVARRNAS